MTSMEDDLNGRRPQWNTTSMEDGGPQSNRTSMEDDHNGRQHLWKTTSMEDDLNGKKMSMEDNLNGRRP